MGEWRTPGWVLVLALRLPAGGCEHTSPVPAGGRRAQVRRAAPEVGAQRKPLRAVAPGALPRQGRHTGPPELGAQGREAELQATAGLTLFPGLVSTQGRAVPRRGQRYPPAVLMPSARLYPGKPVPLRTKGSTAPRPRFWGRERRSPSARPGRGSPNAGGGAEQRLGVRPAPPAPARPPPPGLVTWVLPGFRGGGGGGLGEDAGVTLRAAPRHKAAAPVLGRGHGPSRRGASRGSRADSQHPRRPRSLARGLEGASF